MRVISVPRKRTWPELAGIRPRIKRPTVLLPQPDSPANPKVSWFPISKLTPSTARTWGGEDQGKRPAPFTGKCLQRSRTAMTEPSPGDES